MKCLLCLAKNRSGTMQEKGELRLDRVAGSTRTSNSSGSRWDPRDAVSPWCVRLCHQFNILHNQGLERLLKTGDYLRVNIETSKPVRISEPLRRDVELRSCAPLSIPELQIRKASVPQLSVDNRARVEHLEAWAVKCAILEATTVTVTDLNVKGDARATHVDVCHDMVIGGTLDNIARIRVVGRAVIGSVGSNFSQNAHVSGSTLVSELHKKVSAVLYRNGGAPADIVARTKPVRRRATSESDIAQNGTKIPTAAPRGDQGEDESRQATQAKKSRGLRI
jgi:hypothetical protein